MTKIIFVKVVDNQSKMGRLCQLIQTHFHDGKSVLIAVQHNEAARYLDQLLWKCPSEGFLPHVISDKPVKDSIVITMKHENLNNADILFNLLPGVNPIFTQFKMVYELLDETHPEKLNLSLQRQQFYQNGGHVFQLAEE